MPVYPGDRQPRIIQTAYFNSDGYSSFELSLNSHCGTHIDGPMHMLRGQRILSDYPVECFCGSGCLIDMHGRKTLDYSKDLDNTVPEGSIALIRTGWDSRFGSNSYFNGYPVMTIRLAQYLADRKVKIIGLDSPSPDQPPYDTHKLLMQNGIFIIENLSGLDRLTNAGAFEIFALPLKVAADSAPARVIARLPE